MTTALLALASFAAVALTAAITRHLDRKDHR